MSRRGRGAADPYAELVLREIRIRGLGTIDDVTLELAAGLNVLTGETGAGKTMVVSGLGLLLGQRADSARVRRGSEQAVVEGLVEVGPGHPAAVRAEQAGADVRDALILARSVSAGGRSRAYVGGRSAPVGLLAELGSDLVAVHGQADQWRLRQPEQHREMLDAFGGAPIACLRAEYERCFEGLAAMAGELERLRHQARERARTIDMLQLALEEIEAVDPRPGEDLALRIEVQRLAHADDLRAACSGAHAAIAGPDELDGPGEQDRFVADLLASARAMLGTLTDADPELSALEGRVAELAYLSADVVADLAAYHAKIEADPARLAYVQDRIAALATLQRKYGEHADDVLTWAKDAAARLDVLRTDEERLEGMAEQVARARGELGVRAGRLSAARLEAASRLGTLATRELTHLAMPGARLVVRVVQRDASQESDAILVGGEAASPAGSDQPAQPAQPPGRLLRYARHGVDEVEILLAASAGSAPAPITRAASGGELSRVMLALEVVTAGGQLPTLVFDEIDSGVGGAAALEVGARLARLARTTQVIVVTHFAQVAAYADRHLVVRKDDERGVAVSATQVLTEQDRVRELARMMSGLSHTSAATDHARELLAQARADSGRSH